MTYVRIDLPKVTLYLTTSEVNQLLMQNKEVYITGLNRGKAFKRAEAKKRQYEKKRAKQESEMLNKFI